MMTLTKLPSFRPCNIIGKYAIANKEEIKGSKISEEYEITGIGKKCLKLNEGTFLSWDEIDDSLDTLVDGGELSPVMAAVLEFFLPRTNDEWEKHLGGRIPLPSELAENEETETKETATEENTDEEEQKQSKSIGPQLCFLEVGICKQGGEMGYRLNKKIDKELWYKIRPYFYYDSYNNGGWVCPYSKAKQIEKELGLQITIENQKEQKKYGEHLERQVKKLAKYIKHCSEPTSETLEQLSQNNKQYYCGLNHKKYIITPDKIYEFYSNGEDGKEFKYSPSHEKKIKEISVSC